MAAVVLTATNVLLAPATDAIRTGLGMLRTADGSELPPVQWIAAWSAAAVEVYRSQPALVSAALTARIIQRASLAAPQFPLAPRISKQPRARCEIGAVATERSPDPVTHPRDLEFLDGIAAARLNATGILPEVGTEEPTGVGAGVGDRVVEQLIGLLVEMGTPDGVAHIWVTERVAGQELVWALVPSSGLVRELVETWAYGRGSLPGRDEFCDALADAMAVPFRLPLPTELAAVPLLARRAFVLAAMGIIRQMGLLAPSTWLAGAEFTDLVRGLSDLLDQAFDPDDPVVADTRLRLAVQRASAERHAGRTTPESAAAVMAAADACLEAGAANRIDPGLLLAAQAELIRRLQEELAELKRQLGKNSSNSSTPPSKDSIAAKATRRADRSSRVRSKDRKPGGQPGRQGSGLTPTPDPDRTERVAPRRSVGNAGRICATPSNLAMGGRRCGTFWCCTR
jgi:hypothetical protein